MRNLPPPVWLRSCDAAARLGGFAAAADELALTPAAVSQQSRSWEALVGDRLFHRLPRGVRLTDVGEAYLPAVRRAFDDLSAATTGVFGLSVRDTLVVRAPPSFSALCLAPALAAFRAEHPSVPVRLCTSIWARTAVEDRIHVDIRYGEMPFRDPDAAQLTASESLLVCPPRPKTTPGAQASWSPEQALNDPAIHIMGCEGLWDAFSRQTGMPPVAFDGLSADSSLVALEMVASGLGAALVARDLAAQHVARGQVWNPQGARLAHNQAHYVLLPKSDAAHPAARLFRDWLVGTFHGAAPGA